MSKLKMLKFEAAALQNKGKDLIEQLQGIGVAELESFDEKRLFEVKASDTASMYERSIDVVEGAMEVLKDYGADFGGGMFSGRKVLDREKFALLSQRASDILSDCYEILSLRKEISDLEGEKVRSTTIYDSLKVWKDLDIPLGGFITESTYAIVGTFPREYGYDELKLLFSQNLPEITEYSFKIYYSSKEITSAVFVCHKEIYKQVNAFLRSLSFVAPLETDSENVADKLKGLEENISATEIKIADAVNKIRSFAEKCDDLKFALDFYTVKKDEYEALENVKFSDRTVYLRGYVPEKMASKLSKLVEKNDGAIVYSEPSEDDEVPVLLSNGTFSEPCESIVEMYATPSKGDIDPTAVMAFFYYLLFGMMLSDAGYGLVLLIGSALLLKFTGVEGGMRKMLRMFVYCGISTVFWGALFGSWFGDAIPVIQREFFGIENPPPVALWFDPISDPIKLLLFSFGIGICHLFLGLFALGYMRIRDKDYVGAFCDTVPIILTVLGAAPLAAGVIVSVPAAFTNVAKYLAIVGVVLIVLTASRSGNIFLRLGGGLYGLYNIASGYLSDILSYSRLLALGLATGSIGSVVNMLAVMIDGPVIKEIVFVVVFIVGHTLNMAINVLGAYVHTNRLQFVELFSKFYEGGGKAFNPLKFNTKFFRLKEENEND